MRLLLRVSALVFFCLSYQVQEALCQSTGIRSNALYWFTTTPNAGLEFRLGEQTSLSADFGYNAFNFPASVGAKGAASNPKIHHWLLQPEFKYWFCSVFERGYVGFHGLYGHYNAGGLKFIPFMSETRYRGWAAGGGFSYGYQWALGGRWGVEASLGAGYLYLSYDKYNCGSCGRHQGSYHRHYIGPTKAAVTFIYFIH